MVLKLTWHVKHKIVMLLYIKKIKKKRNSEKCQRNV